MAPRRPARPHSYDTLVETDEERSEGLRTSGNLTDNQEDVDDETNIYLSEEEEETNYIPLEQRDSHAIKVLHPALTDFGPWSLGRFLRSVHAKLQHQASNQVENEPPLEKRNILERNSTHTHESTFLRTVLEDGSLSSKRVKERNDMTTFQQPGDVGSETPSVSGGQDSVCASYSLIERRRALHSFQNPVRSLVRHQSNSNGSPVSLDPTRDSGAESDSTEASRTVSCPVIKASDATGIELGLDNHKPNERWQRPWIVRGLMTLRESHNRYPMSYGTNSRSAGSSTGNGNENSSEAGSSISRSPSQDNCNLKQPSADQRYTSFEKHADQRRRASRHRKNPGFSEPKSQSSGTAQDGVDEQDLANYGVDGADFHDLISVSRASACQQSEESRASLNGSVPAISNFEDADKDTSAHDIARIKGQGKLGPRSHTKMFIHPHCTKDRTCSIVRPDRPSHHDYHAVMPESGHKYSSNTRKGHRTTPKKGVFVENRYDCGSYDYGSATTRSTVHGVSLLADRRLHTDAPVDRLPESTSAVSVISNSHLPNCSKSRQMRAFPAEIWHHLKVYLSANELRVLRLVNKATAEQLVGHLVRSSVVCFDYKLFDLFERGELLLKQPSLSNSMLKQYGFLINKFGISFEIDLNGLNSAPAKTISKPMAAWYGNYVWPIEQYPYYNTIQRKAELAETSCSLLKDAMRHIPKVSELALSIDSGHGWLEGADVSDLQLYKERLNEGSRVFGKSFTAVDGESEAGLREYFKWAQKNSINATFKALSGMVATTTASKEQVNAMRLMRIREYDSYLQQNAQPDHDRHIHTGGVAMRATLDDPGRGALGLFPHTGHGGSQPANVSAQNPSIPGFPIDFASLPRRRRGSRVRLENQLATNDQHNTISLDPQWPLIFNCYNLAADVGGHLPQVQSHVARPEKFPLQPGRLNEAQAQWLMETSWAQRTFLASYTSSLVHNADLFHNVHSMHIAKISSGLLASLGRRDVWLSLPGLRNLTLLVIPDWRQEHLPGDKLFHRNMATDPVNASVKLAEYLKEFICPLEHLSQLRIGFIGGGEHARGLFARNRHVLPAPITTSPVAWLSDHVNEPDPSTVFCFNHIRDLEFQNCWFSPCMLEAFMKKSRDTSLHRLTLESVSLTGSNDARQDGPLSTVTHNLRCRFEASEWLHEQIPPSACWVKVLDNITPGKTLLEHKYDMKMVDEEEEPRPSRHFRGNVQRITFKSCGYVKISGISNAQFGQNGLVVQSPHVAQDLGLEIRRTGFDWTLREASYNERNAFMEARSNITTAVTNSLVATIDNSNLPITTIHPHTNTIPASNADGNFVNAAFPAIDEVDDDAATVTTTTAAAAADNFSATITSSGIGARQSGIMMSTNCPISGKQYVGLGTLTQCVHPVEKRLLEQAWSMTFGWGDTMDRWDAVEDGCFEGGTGRFSGVITHDTIYE